MNYATLNEIDNALNELESLAIKKENKFFKRTVSTKTENPGMVWIQKQVIDSE